jgi:hypothetical protein
VLWVKVLAAAFIMALLFSALAGAVLFGIVHATLSIPEFTVKAVAHSYDVPTTYSTDPYTGETITHEGYHVENRSIEVWIKNIPFAPYDVEGHEVNLYYSVRVKGHFEGDWGTPQTYSESDSAERIPQSNSGYTVLSLVNYYHTDARVDYQVEAFSGHFYTDYHPPGHAIQYPHQAFKVDETSGWSSTQTLTFSENQTPTPSPSTNPTPTPYQEPQQTEQLELDIIIGVVITLAVSCVGLGFLLYLIKRK